MNILTINELTYTLEQSWILLIINQILRRTPGKHGCGFQCGKRENVGEGETTEDFQEILKQTRYFCFNQIVKKKKKMQELHIRDANTIQETLENYAYFFVNYTAKLDTSFQTSSW